MQTGGDSLLPDQKVKIAREDATLQKLRTLEEQHPDKAAAFAASMSKPKKTAPAPTVSAGPVKMVEVRCSSPAPSLPVEVCSSVWIECHTPDGRKFFHDLFTKTSHWELPSPPPPVASIPLPPFQPLKQVHVAREGAASDQASLRSSDDGDESDSSTNDSQSADRENRDPGGWILREKMWALEEQERRACSVCVRQARGTVCGGCDRCPRHCAGLSYCD
jgi:hypothetical protein